MERLMRARPLRRPSPAELHEAFLWAETRVVTKTASVSLFGNHYEVDAALVGARVELVFDPFDLTDIDVRYQQRPMGRAAPRRIGRHTHPAARPDAAPPPKPSGIDYLGLVAARVAAEQARRIGYATMTGPQPEPETPDPPEDAVTHHPPCWDLTTDTAIDDNIDDDDEVAR